MTQLADPRDVLPGHVSIGEVFIGRVPVFVLVSEADLAARLPGTFHLRTAETVKRTGPDSGRIAVATDGTSAVVMLSDQTMAALDALRVVDPTVSAERVRADILARVFDASLRLGGADREADPVVRDALLRSVSERNPDA